jgi:hypothetical protein
MKLCGTHEIKGTKNNRKKRDVLALLAEKYCASGTDMKVEVKLLRS